MRREPKGREPKAEWADALEPESREPRRVVWTESSEELSGVCSQDGEMLVS